MNGSNAWAELSEIYGRIQAAHLEHEATKTDLKKLLPGQNHTSGRTA